MKIMITGATGYIGCHLATHLAKSGHEIFALCRSTSTRIGALPEKLIHIVKMQHDHSDLNEHFSEIKPDVVCHLASATSLRSAQSDIKLMLEGDIRFGGQLLETMAKFGVKYLINTGSYWQYDSDGDFKNPNSLYSASKTALETFINYYAYAHKMQVITLHLSDVYGPNDFRSRLLPQLFNYRQSKKTFDSTHGEQLLDLVHVDDTCSAYQVAIEHLKAQEKNHRGLHLKYFVSSNQFISLRQLVALIEKQLNEKLAINWGAHPYHPLQIMRPFIGDILPGWSPIISTEQGIATVIGKI